MVLRKCEACGSMYDLPLFRNKFFCSNKCYSSTKKGEGNPHWKGGKVLVDGYIYIYSPTHPHKTKDGYVVEHRLVMEKKIGRLLEKREVVHHIDGDKSNNLIKNLVLCKSTGKHSIKFHTNKRDKKGRFSNE